MGKLRMTPGPPSSRTDIKAATEAGHPPDGLRASSFHVAFSRIGNRLFQAREMATVVVAATQV